MENWRPISTHEGCYEVSDRGRVRSVARTVPVAPSKQAPNGCLRKIAARILTACPSGERGVHTVSLWKDHVLRIESIHILVLEAFVGPRPRGLYGCHEDDDVTNNAFANLYWGTPKQNSADKIRNGNQPRGETCGASKLTLAQVEALRARAGTASQEALGRELGIGQAQVSRILNEKHWRI